MHKFDVLKNVCPVKSVNVQRKVYRFYILLLLHGLQGHLYAQQPASNQKFIHYSTHMGLSSSNQQCIVQDKEGFIWIGTIDGLNRFDGHSFKVYRKISHDSTSLLSNYISALLVDREGILWVGTARNGLSRYNKDQDNFTHYTASADPHALSDNMVTSIVEDKAHRLWVGTYRGLNVLDKITNQFVQYHYRPPLAASGKSIAFEQIRTLTLDQDNLWIGYSEGLVSVLHIPSRTFTHYRLFEIVDRNIKESIISSIGVDGERVWVSTWGNGIWVLNSKTGLSHPFEKNKYPFTNNIYKDNRNQIWIGTESDGVLLLNHARDSITQFRHDDFDKYSLSNNCISQVMQDRQGNLWLCSKKGDLQYLITDNAFRVWRRNPASPKELSRTNVTCMLEDRKQRLWVGYIDGGIDIFDAHRSRKQVIHPDKTGARLGEGTVASIYESKNGTIWVGTYLEGLKKYDEQRGVFISFKHDPKDTNTISCNNIKQIAEDSQGNLWLATNGGGLEKLDPATGKFTHYRVNYNPGANTINSDWLMTVLCDKADNIWVGSCSGVSVIDKKSNRVTHYKHNPKDDTGLSNDMVNILFQDGRGMIWIGTNDGLNELNPSTKSIRSYSVKDGLPNSLIFSLLEDNQHNLWISTGKGLSRFSPRQRVFKNYFIEDGLETDEFRIGASFKNAKGEMYFGGIDGLNLFHPDSLKIKSFRPPVYLTDFKVFNQSVPIGHKGKNSAFVLNKPIRLSEEITLNYAQNMIGFEFVALDYLNLQKNQYAYKMEGFDKDWNHSGNKREATYTNLPPGTYTFRVKATNSDGVWNEAGTSVTIHINPPFWKLPIALVLYVFLFGLLLYGCWRLGQQHAKIVRKLEMEKLEIEKLQEMDIQKMRFFSNISHEFRTPLTLLVGPLESLMKSIHDEMQQVQLRIIYRNTQRLLRLINQLTDFRKLESEGLKLEVARYDLIQFAKVVSNSFYMEARQRNMELTVRTEEDSIIAWFDRDKLEKVLFNLIGNAFKFTPDNGTVTVQILLDPESTQKQSSVRIVVADSGIGIPKDSIPKIFDRFYQVDHSLSNYGTGIGLALTKELVQLHGGQIYVESEVGKGTRFTVQLPLRIEQREQLEPAASFCQEHMGAETVTATASRLLEETAIEAIADTEKGGNKPLLHIIEDNFDMWLYMKNEFKDTYRVINSSDGVKGFEKAINEMPDVIISDVMMPEMDGITLCRKLKSDVRTCHIPLVLLTARSSEEHTLEGLESGADDCISKPFHTSILKTKIKNLIESRALLQKRFLKEPTANLQAIAPSSMDEKFLKKAYDMVEKNLSNADLDANDFATEMGMSRAQLYRKISSISGQSVKEFIRIIRLKKAADMLLTSEHNISEVAFAVGFNSLAYFTKSFSDYFGVSPTKYMLLHKPQKSKPSLR